MLNKNRLVQQSNNPINTSSIKSPHSYIIPGTLNSAPTSPSPNIPHALIATTPTSPQPNIQQQQLQWNIHAQSHSHSQPQQSIPMVQPFAQPQPQPQQNQLGSPILKESFAHGMTQL
jgi:hypothetical protein